MKNFFSSTLNFVILIIVAVAIGYWAGNNFPMGKNSIVNFAESMNGTIQVNGVSNLFNQVVNIIKTQYFYSNVNNSNLYYGAIEGMVASLGDPHSEFYDPSEAKQYYNVLDGTSFAGIGVSLGYNSGGYVQIEKVLANTSAASSHVPVGDYIVSINGSSKNVRNINDVVSMVRGVSGTYVTLGLENSDSSISYYKIKREPVNVSSMSIQSLPNGIVDVNILRFSDSSLSVWENNFNSTMSKVEKMNPKGIILDLRGDPGGYFQAAVYAAGEFLPEGSLVAKQQNRDGSINLFDTNYQGNLQNVPMVILVNGGTASAAEILTGALQYYHRATVVGENTYGKGTAQNVFTFSDGSILILTIVHWLLPSGRWITQSNPIIPNVKVTLSSQDFKKGIDTQLQKAESILSN